MKSNKVKQKAPGSVSKKDSEQSGGNLKQQHQVQQQMQSEMMDNDQDSDLDDQMNDVQLDGDVQLPKATMYQLIQEKLPEDVRITNASKDVLISLAMCFINSLSAKANVVCGERGKKTIFPEHVLQAMHQNNQTALLAPSFNISKAQFSKLSFEKQKDVMFQAINGSEYQQRLARSKSIKGNNVGQGQSGISQEELIAEQQKMFNQSRQYEIEFQKQQQEQHYQANQYMQQSNSQMAPMLNQQFASNNNQQSGYQSNFQGFAQSQSMPTPGTGGQPGGNPFLQDLQNNGNNSYVEGQQFMHGEQQYDQATIQMFQETPEERIRNLILSTNFENHAPSDTTNQMELQQDQEGNGNANEEQLAQNAPQEEKKMDVDQIHNNHQQDSDDEVMFAF